MPKDNPGLIFDHHSGLDALVETGVLVHTSGGYDQSAFGHRSAHGANFKHITRRFGQGPHARENPVLDRFGKVTARGQQFIHKERISERPLVEAVRVRRAAAGQLYHRCVAKWSDRHSFQRGYIRQITQNDFERSDLAEVVTSIGGDREDAHLMDSAGKETDEVERGIIRPVDILNDQNRWFECAKQIGVRQVKYFIARCAHRDGFARSPVRSQTHFPQRP